MSLSAKLRLALSLARLIAHVRTPLYRNGYALVFSSAATSCIGVVYWVLAARNYTPEVVGSNAAAIAAMMFLAGVAQLNLMSALVRFVPGAGRTTAPFVMTAYLTATVVAAILSLVFVAGLGTWAPKLAFLGASSGFALWFILATMAWCIFVLQDSVLTGLRQATWVPIENMLFALAKIALLIVFAGLLPEYGVFGSWTVALIVSLLPTNLLIFRRLIPQHVRATEDRVAPFVPAQVITYLPGDYLGALCWVAATTLLPIIVTQVSGAAATAYFYLAWQIAYWLHLISPNMGASLIVEAASDETRLRTYSYRVFVHTALFVGPAAAVLVLGASHILRIFGNDYANEGATLLRLLVLAAIPSIVTSLGISVARVQRRTKFIVATLALLCALALALSYTLLPVYGITGVGIAWLASQTTVAAVVALTQLRPLWLLRPLDIDEGVPALAYFRTIVLSVAARWRKGIRAVIVSPVRLWGREPNATHDIGGGPP